MMQEALQEMNLSPLDEYLQTEGLRQWGSELAEAVAVIPDDQQQRHMAWRTIATLMAGRNILRRVYVAYTFLLQLYHSATRIETVRLAKTMQSEFMEDNDDVFRGNLNIARDKAVARIGQV